MFDKLKQGKEILKARGQLSEMQKKMGEYTHTETKNEIKVKAKGNQEIEYIEIDGEPQPVLVKLINTAIKKAQEKAGREMLKSGDMGLSDLLGGLK